MCVSAGRSLIPTLFPLLPELKGTQDLELPQLGGVPSFRLHGDPPDTDVTSPRPPPVQRNNPARVCGAGAELQCRPGGHNGPTVPLSLGDNGALILPGRAEQRPDLLSGAGPL